VTVREDHTNEKDVVNTVVSLSLKDQIQHVLVSGADFYSFPRVSSDGKYLCWVEWNHPNMVWFSLLSLLSPYLTPNSQTQSLGTPPPCSLPS